MKVYSKASEDVELHIDRMKREHHEKDLGQATIQALFIFDAEKSHDHVLTHNGYPAGAVIKVTSTKERALGLADAVVVIDRAYWTKLTARQRDALVDHELQHLMAVEDMDDDDKPQKKFDVLGRPILRMRKHDYQMGWFAEVAHRHGQDSPEVRQAKQLIAETQQLFFDFTPEKDKARSSRAGSWEAEMRH